MVVKVSPETVVRETLDLANPVPFGVNTRPVIIADAAVGGLKVGAGQEAKVPAPAAVKLFRNPLGLTEKFGVIDEKARAKLRC